MPHVRMASGKYSCCQWGIMKYLMYGLIITLLLMSSALAEEVNDTASGSPVGGEWMLDKESGAALVELYAADLRMIQDGYGALILKDTGEIADFREFTRDSNQTINGLLDILDGATNEHAQATADLWKLYDAYDALNASGLRMLDSFEADNLSWGEDDVTAYKDAAVNLTRTFDDFIGTYLDKNTMDEQTFRLLLYTHLINAVNAQEGFVLTADPALSDLFAEKMSAFDADAAIFESRFPDVSITEIRDLKQRASDVVAETMPNVTENGAEADMSPLIPVVKEIMAGYHQVSTI
jgi:hypothetical protein